MNSKRVIWILQRFFSSLSVEECKPQLWLNEQLLAAFISFLSSNRNMLGSNAISRKKTGTEVQRCFFSIPEMDLLKKLQIFWLGSLRNLDS